MDNFGTVNGVPKRWWGNTEPTDKKMIWYRNGKAYAYANGEWSESTGGGAYDDIDGALYCFLPAVTNTSGSMPLEDAITFSNLYYASCPVVPDDFKFAPRTGAACGSMFFGNYKITNVNSFDTSNAVNCVGMFSGCIALKSIGLLDMSNVRNLIQYDSEGNPQLGVSGIYNMFFSIYTYSDAGTERKINLALTDLGGFKDLGKGFVEQIKTFGNNAKPKLDLAYCNNITHDSLMNVINTVYDFSNDFTTPCTSESDACGYIALHNDAYSRLSADDIAIANKKGWFIYG